METEMSLGIDVRSDFDSVPVIDFAGMLTSDPGEKAKVAAALRDACANVGFFYIKNHGVPLPLIVEMFAQSARFFRLPLEDKAVLHVKKSPHLVGYIGMKEENADPAVSKGDIHEGFDFIAEDVETAAGFLEGDFRKTGNQWPANLPGFRELMTEYTIAVRLLARRLFAAFALGLDLPEDYFVPLSNKPMALTRMMFYPSETGPLDLTRMGVGAHTDHECFTILAQDTVEALQVRNRRGQWIDAPPIPGTFVVNIGDQMARWTNGAFASTFHRVYNASGRERYSIPTFVGANADAVIEALPSCVSEENPAKFEPIVAGEYVTSLIYHNIHNNSVPNPAKIRPEV
jgi:isopenicillin N synthase-like dioxygenase